VWPAKDSTVIGESSPTHCTKCRNSALPINC